MKYLKCAGIALGLDVAVGGVLALLGAKPKFWNVKPTDFGMSSFASLIFSTLPAIGANVVDKYVNQNISDNKYFQYGATALEAGLINVGMSELAIWLDTNSKMVYIKNLIKLECSADVLQAKLFFANAIAQGLLFHYILSQEKANESGDGDRVLFGDAVNDNLKNTNEVNDNSNSNRNESVVWDDDVNNNNIPVTPDYS